MYILIQQQILGLLLTLLGRYYISSHEALFVISFNDLSQHAYLYNNKYIGLDVISMGHFVMPFNAF